MLVMVFAALVTLPVFYVDSQISRMEGGLLLTYYVVYVAYVVMQAANNPALPRVTLFIASFVILTFIVLIVLAVRSTRTRRNVKI